MAKDRLRLQAAVEHGTTVALSSTANMLPIDPVAIAKKKEIAVEERDLEGCFGCLVKSGDTFGIAYSSALNNPGVVRFTVAHELGHYFLEGHAEQLFGAGDGVHSSRSGFVSSLPHEREADHFACGLLMPQSLFLQELRQCDPGFAAIRHLSEVFRTSITSTAIRYAYLAEDPVAVIISQGQAVCSCFMSECLRDLRGVEWPRKGSTIPPKSATAEFNREPKNIRAAREVEGAATLDEWLDGAPDIEVREDVIGLGRYKRTLTVLVSEEALPEEPDEDDS